MSPSKTIAVVGATGNQGSSVAKTFTGLPDWHVRCLTRNPASEKAQALKALGAEVHKADLDNLESLVSAFKGAHVIFVNTDFWLPYSAALSNGDKEASRTGLDTESRHARNAATAASRTTTLERYIYSALGPMKAASGGKYDRCYHWDSKAAAVDFVENEMPELAKKTSYIYLGAYSSNPFLLPQRKDGGYALALPAPKETMFPIIDPQKSTGPFVRALIDEPAGTKLLAYDSSLTIAEAMDSWSKVTGKETGFVHLPLDEMHETTGLPYEILHGPAFLGEYDFMAGVEGRVITPEVLKNKVAATTYPEFLASKSMDYLLGSEFPKF